MATKRPPQEGKTATSLDGSICVDIEMYEVSPNNAVKVRGTTTFSLALKHLFPTASGVIGPLRFRMPSTVRVWVQDYGLDCLSVRKVKTLTKNGSAGETVQIPRDCRRSIWPCVPLQRCTVFFKIELQDWLVIVCVLRKQPKNTQTEHASKRARAMSCFI